MNNTAKRLLLSSLPQGIVQNGLIAEYKFNEGSGQILNNHKRSPFYPTNFVTNGNFANGTTGWFASPSAVITAANNILTCTGNGGDDIPRFVAPDNPSLFVGKTVYGRFRVRVTNALCAYASFYVLTPDVRFVGQIISPVENTWYELSGLVVTPGTGTMGTMVFIHGYADAATANGKVMEVQEVMLIDLTALFGAGNEPSAAWCDANFPTWFDGTIYAELPANSGQLGSTTGADTNDPTWSAQGLTFATDDYCVMPVPFNVNGDWTVYLVAKRDGNPAGNEYFWSIGKSTAAVPLLGFAKDTSGNWFLLPYTDINTTAFILTSGPGDNLIAIKKNGTLYTIKSLTVGNSVSVEKLGVFAGLDLCSLGALRRNTVANFLNGEIAYYLPYSRATSDAEDTQNYRALKKILAGRGITI